MKYKKYRIKSLYDNKLTGGDSGPGLEGLEQIFLNPQSFDVLPYYNNYNKAEEYTLTGFFVPAFTVVPNFMDKRGVTDEVKAKEYYNKEREKKSGTPQNYLEYCSEFCFYYYTAASENYLLKNGVLQKVWDILEYLNQNTEGGMRHVRMKKNEPMWKRASSLTAKGEESGWMAEIFGQIVDDPKKLRGARVEFLFMEEAGSFPKLVTVWNQAEALVKLLGKRIGIRCCWGRIRCI